MNAVLVINADLGPLHRVSLRHALRMLWRQVAVVHEAEPNRQIGVYPMPRVVRLVSYVVTRWRHTKGPAWSRAGVLARDDRRCAYCGGPAATIDHVVPSSRGGKNTWTNTVAACGGCNQRKGNRAAPSMPRDLAHGKAAMQATAPRRRPVWCSGSARQHLPGMPGPRRIGAEGGR